MTIVEFLLARITEDEATHPVYGYLENVEHHEVGCMELAAVERSDARCDCDGPRRWLAECQAKRAILEQHRNELGTLVVYRESDRLIAEGYDLGTVPLRARATMIPNCIRHLATVYADHPDYQPEWAPTSEV